MKRTTSSYPGQSSWSLLLKRPSFGWALNLRLWASRRKKNKVPVNDFQFWLLHLFSLQHHRHHPNRWSPSAKNLQLSKILSLKLESYSIALHALPTSWILPFHFIFPKSSAIIKRACINLWSDTLWFDLMPINPSGEILLKTFWRVAASGFSLLLLLLMFCCFCFVFSEGVREIYMLIPAWVFYDDIDTLQTPYETRLGELRQMLMW